jgi:NAD(P)-dependent dehydrogenase (short-subunit alcohol dehydrogenase family)
MQGTSSQGIVPSQSGDVEACLRVLRAFAADPVLLSNEAEIGRLISRIYKRARKERRRLSQHSRVQSDAKTVQNTGRFRMESNGTPLERNEISLNSDAAESVEVFTRLRAKSRKCYICKQSYRQVHHFYHLLCPECASLNFSKRNETSDLTGRQSLVSGGRIKIGFQTALKLLRCSASVTVTTRFPKDAAFRFSQEDDFDSWQHRLRIQQADFRNVPGLLTLIERLDGELPALDILVNNAAQSVRDSPESIARLQQIESNSHLSANQSSLLAVKLSQAEGSSTESLIPALVTIPHSTSLDRNGELVDLRENHSWTDHLADVESVDLLEVLLINANAPCLLASKLKPLFLRSSYPDRYIINVTGLDGQFGRAKSARHPHVNMSKAALNMLTRTSAQDYAYSGIYMNSVDTGWITHLASHSWRIKMHERGFVPPLDEVDGGARILEPILQGIKGERVFGKLFRHFRQSNW